MDWLKARLKEKTTWLGIISAVASLTGITVAPELAEQIGAAAVAVVGVVLMVLNEQTAE